MRAAKRALGGQPAHAPRLKGATSRSVRRFLGAAFPRGSCAFQSRALLRAQPQAASPHGVISVPHFMRERASGAKRDLPEATWLHASLTCRFSKSVCTNFLLGKRSFQSLPRNPQRQIFLNREGTEEKKAFHRRVSVSLALEICPKKLFFKLFFLRGRFFFLRPRGAKPRISRSLTQNTKKNSANAPKRLRRTKKQS